MKKIIHIMLRISISGFLLLLLSSPLLANTIKGRDQGPLFSWHGSTGTLNNKGQALLKVLSEAYEQGLEPTDYLPDKGAESTSDEALTKAALAYIRDLKVGRKPPAIIDPTLLLVTPKIDAMTLLSSVYASDDVIKALDNLAPNYPEYRLLMNRLAEYRQVEEQGGWPKVPDGQSLEVGMVDTAVTILRQRLVMQGYLKSFHQFGADFDEPLDAAVRNFQMHHGLIADGKVGRRTREALNVPIRDRIRQIILNMERWRWLPDDLGQTHLRVNIAGFYLRLYEESRVVMEMPVIVGKPYRKTPVFSSVISDLTFHPYWHVPVKIAYLNIIPEIVKDTGYLQREEFEVLQSGPDGRQQIVERPEALPWQSFLQGNFDYLLRQKPGRRNALGHVRFNITNDFGIYMHGTPNQELFADVTRAASSGCIRLANPLKLAKYILKDNPAWPESRIDQVYSQFEAINNPKPLLVALVEPVPVHILYWTVWGEGDDHLYFRNDIYGRDKILAQNLF